MYNFWQIRQQMLMVHANDGTACCVEPLSTAALRTEGVVGSPLSK